MIKTMEIEKDLDICLIIYLTWRKQQVVDAIAKASNMLKSFDACS
jgi:hypothetical protein